MSPRRVLALVLAFAATGCADQHRLASCRGPVMALNAAVWQPTPADLAALERLCPSDGEAR